MADLSLARRKPSPNMRGVELVRVALELSEEAFARTLGVAPEHYAQMLHDGRVSRLVKFAARGLAAEQQLDLDTSFVVRIVDGMPFVVKLDQLRATTLGGRHYLLLPVTQPQEDRFDGEEEVATLAAAAIVEIAKGVRQGLGGDAAPAAGTTQHDRIIADVVTVLGGIPDGLRPKVILERLEAASADWLPDRPRAQRLARLGSALWLEARKPHGRLRSPRRGCYRLAARSG
jgi:hypothetical protein